MGTETGADRRQVVVLGAGGFAGAELLRLVVCHPHLELVVAESGTHAGRPVGEVLPHLAPWTGVGFTAPGTLDQDRLGDGAWTVLAALPHGTSMQRLPSLLELAAGHDVQVVDLSGDFRLRDAGSYAAAYGRPHQAVQHLGELVYGLPELGREQIAAARAVANPGCFATAVSLALLPAAGAPWEVESVAVTGITGSSGAGVEPRASTHHPLRAGEVQAYRLLDHQHVPEMLQAWAVAGGDPAVPFSFVPHRGPQVRGIAVTAQLVLSEAASAEEVREVYCAAYGDEPFVRVLDGPPSLRQVCGSNRCDLHVAARDRMVVVCAVIDNLVKGAAGQAIQNVNLMSRWPETAGLLMPAPQPV
jgi:N-acetyl-gamma-glutamyl-phosphate reductase